MSSELPSLTIHVLGFATGAALCALLALMQSRADRSERKESPYLLLWLVGFVWTFGSFVHFGLLLAGFRSTDALVYGAEVFSWSSTCLGPILIARITAAKMQPGSKRARVFLHLAIVLSLVLGALLIGAAYAPGFAISLDAFGPLSFFVALSLTVLGFVIYLTNRRVSSEAGIETRGPPWFTRAAVALISLQVFATLISIVVELPSSAALVIGLISGQWAIPWAILVAVFLAQAHYADLVLKRSLTLLLAVTTGGVVSLWLNVPMGFRFVTTTILIAALMLITPMLMHLAHRLVDTVLLRRPDYLQAAEAFEDALRAVENEPAVLNEAQRALQESLRAPVDVQRTGDPAGGPHVLARVPIRENDSVLQVRANDRSRALMQQELAYINAVVLAARRRMDSIRLERERRELEVREERMKRLLTEAELKALRAQVDPHFLFNTLNTIADLIATNPTQAEVMTERLAECFRYALSRQSRELTTLDEEFEFVRQYLGIEQVRFGDRLKLELSRGDVSGNEPVPSLILQPLVENAIRHGLAPKPEGGVVCVRADREGKYLRLEVNDDGVGISSNAVSRSGIGLQNVRERLQTLYRHAAQMSVQPGADGCGTSITLLVPLHEN